LVNKTFIRRMASRSLSLTASFFKGFKALKYLLTFKGAPPSVGDSPTLDVFANKSAVGVGESPTVAVGESPTAVGNLPTAASMETLATDSLRSGSLSQGSSI